jgi:hypothetical protein
MLLKNGAKQAELDWMGWNEIAENKKSITKAEIYDWIERNRIDIKEVDSKFTDVDEYEESIDDFLDKLYSIYSIIPSQASKLGKPFDARVEDITIDDFTVKSIPVTEKMKHSVMEKGVPFFHSQIQYADASKYDFDVSGITEENAQEMQAIKDKSVENGTFMKAPNGKQSNLNERQWLQVRTGAFKKWFGDWEGAAQAIKGIEILRSFFNGKTGLLGNVNNPQIGSINIYSGEAGTETKQYKNGNGLEHIIARRWIEGNNVAETLFGINDALARGKILRDYGGENGRIDLQYGDYIAVISKQRFGNAEQWTLTGFKIKSDVERESYNPDDYALYSSVSRNKVGADFNAKVQQKIDSANSYSRVVDANGEPLVVYHGTSNEFTVFGEKKGNSQGTYLKNRNGFFFANRKEAELYGNGILMPAFINLRNPNMVDVQHNLSELEYDYKTEREEAEAAGYPIARWLGEGEAAFEANDSATAYLDDNMDEIIEETENNNNDGVFVIGADGSRTVISLAPSQIKSAAANNGNFDNNSDDIRFQRKYKNVGAGSVRAGLKPALAEIQNEISRAEQETDTNPTEGQKKAGNYRKGHVRIQGFDISIEQPKGSVRRGVDENGKAWESKMYNTYGYFGKTESRDGDHIDVFLGENPLSKKVFVVDQVNPETGNFDEHKVMFGFDSIDAARKAYLSNYEKGWKGLGSITETDVETFRSWANKDGARVKAFSQYRDIPSGVEEKKTRIEKLRNSKPVEITGKEITPSEDLKEYRKNANDYGLTLRDSYTNKDTGKNISLGKSGVKEVTSHDLSKEQLQSVAAIPQIIENAIYIDTINNEDSDKNSDVASYDYFVAGLKIDGVDYTVKAVVANGVNGERYYDHKLTQIEKTKLIDLLNQSAYSSALSGLSSKTASGVLSNEDSGNQSQGNKTSTPVSAIKDKRLLSILKTEPSQSTEKPDDGVRFQIRSAGKASDAGADSKSDITDRARASLNRKLSGTTRLREIYQDRFIAVKHFIDTLKKFGTEVADHDNWYLSATHQDGKVDAQLDAYNRKFQRPLNEIISRRFDIHCEGLSFSSGKHQVHCSLLQCRWRKSMPSI